MTHSRSEENPFSSGKLIHLKMVVFFSLYFYFLPVLQIVNIKYLEDKLNKSKSVLCTKLMDRRREDVRDQMIELSAKPVPQMSTANGSGAAAAASEVELAARQRRTAEREGRRRRRLQQRMASQQALKVKHNEGISSVDELETSDQVSCCQNAL